MQSRPYFQAWSPHVFDLHVRFGLRPVPGHEKQADPPVTFCMSRWSEGYTFAHSWLGNFGFRQLTRSHFQGWAHLIATRFLFTSPFALAREQNTLDVYGTLGPRYTSERMDADHLVVQEIPREMGETDVAESTDASDGSPV